MEIFWRKKVQKNIFKYPALSYGKYITLVLAKESRQGLHMAQHDKGATSCDSKH